MSDHVQEHMLGFVRGRYPGAQISGSDDIFALGFVNSLFAMELVMFIEKEFSVTISNDELQIDNFRTAQCMSELVARCSPVAASVRA
jgi:methoxymalonate biosynthesis acyl carrier protein